MEVLTPSTTLRIHATSMETDNYTTSKLGRTSFLAFFVFVVVVVGNTIFVVVDMEQVVG